ncbi:MAG: HIT family protein [Planctomycetaceae bacterium]|nr:HIT family protein [Planctomycetaceae bacterium]
MNAECIFCKIVSGQIPCTKVFENEHLLAFLDIHPAAQGHTLVVSKRHYDRIDRSDPQTLAEIAKALPKLTAAVQKAAGADGYNVLCNNGPAAGQAVEHLHFHIIPRRAGDGVMKAWKPQTYPQAHLEQIAGKINAELAL